MDSDRRHLIAGAIDSSCDWSSLKFAVYWGKSEVIDERSDAGGAEAVIDIDYRDVGGAGI